MEIDLEQAGVNPSGLPGALRAQVCVVGGGIAGLIVCQRLAAAGISVTLLEAGGIGREGAANADPFALDSKGRLHRGSREGRVRALGGTSVTWGGQLLPLPPASTWPLDGADLRRYEAEADELLGVDGLAYQASRFFEATGMAAPDVLRGFADWSPRLSKFVPYTRRNLGASLGRDLLRNPRVNVVLHASVVELIPARTQDRVQAVALQTRNGTRFNVEADQFVLAAGTIDTCRLLLASRSGTGAGLGNRYGQVGRNFQDHLTLTAATFSGSSRAAILRELRPWILSSWHGGTVHSLKLETTPELQARFNITAAMAHVTVEEPEGSGVGALRQLLRARQEGRPAREPVAQWLRVPGAISEGVRLAWSARVRHRRYVSRDATVRLQINMAQEIPSKSHICLSEDRDARGIPRVVVDWTISEGDLRGLRRFATLLRDRFRASGMDDGLLWQPDLFAEGSERDEALLDVIDDARHAMGGACMGADPRTSVVDPELRVHGLANLSVASAAVFPDGSAQLPTLTLAALCLRLADRLQKQLA